MASNHHNDAVKAGRSAKATPHPRGNWSCTCLSLLVEIAAKRALSAEKSFQNWDTIYTVWGCDISIYMLLLFVEGFLWCCCAFPIRWGKEGPGVVWGWLRFCSLGLYIQWGGGLPIAFKGRSYCELEHCLATIRNDITWVDLTQIHVLLQKVVQWFVLLTDNILRLTSEAEGLFHFIAKRSGTYTFIVRAPRAWCWTGAPTIWGIRTW